mmetsp:Transcript_70553/g.204467  ORF Transcript_70553/g.204467 Transcript_70553/m.204467 type:complete len:284 (-) Transcript_70553:459-1310(-)
MKFATRRGCRACIRATSARIEAELIIQMLKPTCCHHKCSRCESSPCGSFSSNTLSAAKDSAELRERSGHLAPCELPVPALPPPPSRCELPAWPAEAPPPPEAGEAERFAPEACEASEALRGTPSPPAATEAAQEAHAEDPAAELNLPAGHGKHIIQLAMPRKAPENPRGQGEQRPPLKTVPALHGMHFKAFAATHGALAEDRLLAPPEETSAVMLPTTAPVPQGKQTDGDAASTGARPCEEPAPGANGGPQASPSNMRAPPRRRDTLRTWRAKIGGKYSMTCS